jgi:hypothetical protein
MLNITSSNGEVTLSYETPMERLSMAEFYARQEASEKEGKLVMLDEFSGAKGETTEKDVSDETARDNRDAQYFENGWKAAIAETQLRYVNGDIEQFWNEQAQAPDPEEMPKVDLDADDDAFIEALKEAHPEATVPAVVKGDPDIHPVVNSGEPEEEKNRTWDPSGSGTWTMSSEELQSRLDESYRRGAADGRAHPAPKQTSERTLRIIAGEIDHELFPGGGTGPSELTRGEVFTRFSVVLATRLGFEISK